MSLRICRFGGTILPTRFMVKTYWAMGFLEEWGTRSDAGRNRAIVAAAMTRSGNCAPGAVRHAPRPRGRYNRGRRCGHPRHRSAVAIRDAPNPSRLPTWCARHPGDSRPRTTAPPRAPSRCHLSTSAWPSPCCAPFTNRLHHAHPDPGPGHSRRAGRRRPARRRPDRHRQDRRLHAADAAPPDGQARRARRRAAALPIRALILTPTRELAAQVEESVRTYGKHAKLTSHGDVRRRRHAAADRPLRARRRHPRRHAGPPARPPPARAPRPVARRDLRPRRSRPHARHGLHPRHQEGAGDAAGEEAEPAVLGDLLRRDQGAGRPPAERAGADRGGAPQPDRRDRSRRRSTRSAARARRTCWRT